VRRWKPGIAALVLDADPVAFFTAQEQSDIEVARQVEPFFTYLFREAMDTTYPTIQLADLIAWRGHAYTREGWDYRTTKEVRVANIDELFPGGVEAVVAQTVQAAEQQGEQIDAIQVVARVLAEQYELDPNDPAEGQMLQQASVQVLQGKKFVRLVYRVIEKDIPRWEAIDPINVIVPQDQDPENAEFFTIIHMMTEDQLRALGIDGHLPLQRVEKLIAAGQKSSSPQGDGSADAERDRIRDLMDARAGRSQRQAVRDSGMFTVWEIYCRLDINGDGERERAILWYSPTENETLALLEYPYPFDSWPITYYPFEAARRPIDNRGIADMIKTFQRLVNAYHNARIDASQLLLSPVFLQRLTGGNFKRNLKFRPGSVIPVQNTSDILPLQTDMRLLAGLLQEEQSNRREAETYVGVFDAAITNLSATKERRTAAEVNAIQSLSSSIFGLDAKIFQVAFSKSLTKIWQLYEDFGPKEMIFRVSGKEFPSVARKSEIKRNFDIRASGTPSNTNRALQLGNLERIMGVVLQPTILQTGRIDFAELIRKWVQLVDVNIANAIIRTGEEATAAQTVMRAAAIAEGEGEAPAL
jgi:hypothetical protein